MTCWLRHAWSKWTPYVFTVVEPGALAVWRGEQPDPRSRGAFVVDWRGPVRPGAARAAGLEATE
mgnify:CR=1 FL=1